VAIDKSGIPKVIFMLLLLSLACSQTSIDDGAAFGPFAQVKTSFTSAFVATSESGAVLVDAGFQDNGKAVAAYLETQGLTLDDVTDVLITHGHTDHVAGIPAYPNATVWAHENEVELILEEGPEGVSVDETLVDGQIIEAQGFAFEAILVPGHTSGNLVFLSEGVLITGDTAFLYKDGTVGPPSERYSLDPAQTQAELLVLRDRLEPRKDEITAVGFAHTGGLTGDLSAFWEMTARE
jgi:glyoxylase-like metal-dependent hydrolase (beta-lactamase superfamily II)